MQYSDNKLQIEFWLTHPAINEVLYRAEPRQGIAPDLLRLPLHRRPQLYRPSRKRHQALEWVRTNGVEGNIRAVGQAGTEAGDSCQGAHAQPGLFCCCLAHPP